MLSLKLPNKLKWVYAIWGLGFFLLFFFWYSDMLYHFFNVKISEIFHRCLGMPRNIPFKCLIGHCWLPQAIYFSALGPQKLIPQLVSFLLLDSVLSSKYTHSFVFSLVKQLPTTLQNHRDEKVVLVVHTGMFVTQASVLRWTLVNTLFFPDLRKESWSSIWFLLCLLLRQREYNEQQLGFSEFV